MLCRHRSEWIHLRSHKSKKNEKNFGSITVLGGDVLNFNDNDQHL